MDIAAAPLTPRPLYLPATATNMSIAKSLADIITCMVTSPSDPSYTAGSSS